jgi:hypothetical protein
LVRKLESRNYLHQRAAAPVEICAIQNRVDSIILDVNILRSAALELSMKKKENDSTALKVLLGLLLSTAFAFAATILHPENQNHVLACRLGSHRGYDMEPMPKKSDFPLLCLVQTRQPVLEP